MLVLINITECTMGESLKDKAYRHIRRKVMEGTLTPDMRLSNRALAGDMGMSFIPVREAINQLVSEGIVTERPGLGFFVANPGVGEIIEIYELREALELHAAAKAAETATSEEIGDLQEANRHLRTLVQQASMRQPAEMEESLAEEIIRADMLFHLSILKIAKNTRMMKIVRDFQLVTRFYHRRRIYAGWERLLTALDEHDQIVECIRNNEPERLRDLIHRHMTSGRDIMLRVYDQMQKDKKSTSDDLFNELL